MKKQLFFSLMMIVTLGLASCTYPTYVTEECKFNKKTLTLRVTQDKWDYDQSTGQFFCHFDVPELTAQVYNYGEVSVNREYNSGTNKAYQVALPETSYKVEEEVDGSGQVINTFYYAQHVDYVYGLKFVEVFYTISDYIYPDNWVPEEMYFRLQMTY